jgi:epoxide hydrolase-like predicted phosphatase
MIKAAIFDFGNVVHSLKNYNPRQDIADFYGLQIDEISDQVKQPIEELGLGHISEEDFWRDLSLKLNQEVPANSKEVFRKIKDHVELNLKVIDFVKVIKEKGIQALVLSNTNQPHEDVLIELGWYSYFDKIYLSHKVGLRKPDSKIYELILRENNLKGEECIYIDDLAENLTPANQLGMKTILAVDEEQVVNDLMKMLE